MRKGLIKLYLPTRVRDLPGYLHLLRGSFVQFLEATRQSPLDRRRLLWCPVRVHIRIPAATPTESGSKQIVAEDRAGEPRSPHTARAASHAREGARRAEELGEYILGVPRVEAEHVGTVPAGGEVGGAAIGSRGRDLALEPFFSVLVVDRTLLGIAQDL